MCCRQTAICQLLRHALLRACTSTAVQGQTKTKQILSILPHSCKLSNHVQPRTCTHPVLLMRFAAKV